MAIEMISPPISEKECCWTGGSNPGPEYQSDTQWVAVKKYAENFYPCPNVYKLVPLERLVTVNFFGHVIIDLNASKPKLPLPRQWQGRRCGQILIIFHKGNIIY